MYQTQQDRGEVQCWNWPKRTVGGESAAKMFEILPRDWSLWPIFSFHSKISVCRHELGGVQPQPRQFQPWWGVNHYVAVVRSCGVKSWWRWGGCSTGWACLYSGLLSWLGSSLRQSCILRDTSNYWQPNPSWCQRQTCQLPAANLFHVCRWRRPNDVTVEVKRSLHRHDVTWRHPVSPSDVTHVINDVTVSHCSTLWRPMLPNGYSYTASCARPG